MVGLSINESIRTAATDGALSFSILLQNTRDLSLSASQSAVTGLLSAIREAPADYSRLLDAAADAIATQETAALKLTQPPWTAASVGTSNAIRAQLESVFASFITAQRSAVTDAGDAAAGIAASATNPSTLRSLALEVDARGDALLAAMTLIEGGSDAAGLAALDTARAQAATTLASVQARLAVLNGQTPLPTAEIQKTLTLIDSTEAMIEAADAVAANTFVGPAGESPTTYELSPATPPATFLSVWGSSGAFSLTDATGNGVLITGDGKVDTIPPSGAGWQFASDSTFLLPDGTKVSVSPGSPASVLVTRGQQRITIDSLANGQTPSVQQHTGGGLAADASRNDGYIFETSGSLSAWTLAGAVLGDVAGSREAVALTPIANERLVDVTATPLPAELADFLSDYGIDPADFDANGDGSYSNAELRSLVATLDAAVGGIQTRFEAALSNVLAAADSLSRLNTFIEQLLAAADRRDANRRQLTASERDQLVAIQREIAAALAALRAERSRSEGRPTLVGDALSILGTVAQPLGGTAGSPPRNTAPIGTASSAAPRLGSGDGVGGTVAGSEGSGDAGAFAGSVSLGATVGTPTAGRASEPSPLQNVVGLGATAPTIDSRGFLQTDPTVEAVVGARGPERTTPPLGIAANGSPGNAGAFAAALGLANQLLGFTTFTTGANGRTGGNGGPGSAFGAPDISPLPGSALFPSSGGPGGTGGFAGPTGARGATGLRGPGSTGVVGSEGLFGGATTPGGAVATPSVPGATGFGAGGFSASGVGGSGLSATGLGAGFGGSAPDLGAAGAARPESTGRGPEGVGNAGSAEALAGLGANGGPGNAGAFAAALGLANQLLGFTTFTTGANGRTGGNGGPGSVFGAPDISPLPGSALTPGTGGPGGAGGFAGPTGPRGATGLRSPGSAGAAGGEGLFGGATTPGGAVATPSVPGAGGLGATGFGASGFGGSGFSATGLGAGFGGSAPDLGVAGTARPEFTGRGPEGVGNAGSAEALAGLDANRDPGNADAFAAALGLANLLLGFTTGTAGANGRTGGNGGPGSVFGAPDLGVAGAARPESTGRGPEGVGNAGSAEALAGLDANRDPGNVGAFAAALGLANQLLGFTTGTAGANGSIGGNGGPGSAFGAPDISPLPGSALLPSNGGPGGAGGFAGPTDPRGATGLRGSGSAGAAGGGIAVGNARDTGAVDATGGIALAGGPTGTSLNGGAGSVGGGAGSSGRAVEAGGATGRGAPTGGAGGAASLPSGGGNDRVVGLPGLDLAAVLARQLLDLGSGLVATNGGPGGPGGPAGLGGVGGIGLASNAPTQGGVAGLPPVSGPAGPGASAGLGTFGGVGAALTAAVPIQGGADDRGAETAPFTVAGNPQATNPAGGNRTDPGVANPFRVFGEQRRPDDPPGLTPAEVLARQLFTLGTGLAAGLGAALGRGGAGDAGGVDRFGAGEGVGGPVGPAPVLGTDGVGGFANPGAAFGGGRDAEISRPLQSVGDNRISESPPAIDPAAVLARQLLALGAGLALSLGAASELQRASDGAPRGGAGTLDIAAPLRASGDNPDTGSPAASDPAAVLARQLLALGSTLAGGLGVAFGRSETGTPSEAGNPAVAGASRVPAARGTNAGTEAGQTGAPDPATFFIERPIGSDNPFGGARGIAGGAETAGGPSALGQSLRRAERLLSGFAGGSSGLRFTTPLPPPTVPAPLSSPLVPTPRSTRDDGIGPVAGTTALAGTETGATTPLAPSALRSTPPLAAVGPVSPRLSPVPTSPSSARPPEPETATPLPNRVDTSPDPAGAFLPPRQPNGLPVLEGSRFAAVGPDPAVAPDTTFGAADGFAREYSRRFDQHRGAYETALQRSGQIQVQVRQVVETFLVLVGKDEDLRRVFTTDDLSDEQQIQFKDKVRLIERELGVTWGTEPEKTPQGQAKLSNRMLASGLMI
jgi:hypothetical protein